MDGSTPRPRNDGAWRVLDLTTFDGHVSAYQHHLRTSNADGCRTETALADVTVILLGPDAEMSTGTVGALASHHIVTLWCDWAGVPHSVTHPWPTHTRVTAIHRAQAAMSRPRAKAAWKALVRAKISGQSAVLRTFGAPRATYLATLAQAVRSGDQGNIEGRAARIYWPSLVGDPEFRRERYDPHPLNAALNYGYAILRGVVIRELLASGLNPTLGVAHRGRSNYFAFADDLIEPFRPAVDHCAMQILDQLERPLTKVNRAHLGGFLRVPFDSSGAMLPTAVSRLTRAMANYITEPHERQQLQVPTWKGRP